MGQVEIVFFTDVSSEGSVDSVLMEVNRLDIMLIIEGVIKLTMQLVSGVVLDLTTRLFTSVMNGWLIVVVSHVTSLQMMRLLSMVFLLLGGFSLTLVLLLTLFLLLNVLTLWLEFAELSLLLLTLRLLVVMGTLGESLVMSHSILLEVSNAMIGVVVLMVVMDVVMVVLWLHLYHKIATTCVHILRVENTAIRLKSATELVPAGLVKLVEVIAPVQVEVVSVRVVFVGLNIVEKEVPWHIFVSEVSSPSVEGGCPEVHPQRLSLVHEVNRLVVILFDPTHSSAIN